LENVPREGGIPDFPMGERATDVPAPKKMSDDPEYDKLSGNGQMRPREKMSP
jgi:hypothetical protein